MDPLTPPTTFSTAPARRNWRALSLRSLLVLFTLLAVWLAIVANRAREQRRIVNALSQYPNAMIMYDYQWDLSAGGEIPKPRPLSPPPGPLWIRSRLGDEYFVTVIGVFLTGDWNRASDPPLREALEAIGDLPALRVLSLEGLPITDAELGAVAGQTDLTYLWLDETPISDAGLVHLRRMRKLKYLYLRQSNVTDTGIDALKRDLPQVRICYGRGSPQKIK
jgi:hypothetical protein